MLLKDSCLLTLRSAQETTQTISAIDWMIDVNALDPVLKVKLLAMSRACEEVHSRVYFAMLGQKTTMLHMKLEKFQHARRKKIQKCIRHYEDQIKESTSFYICSKTITTLNTRYKGTTGRIELQNNPVALTINLKSVPEWVSGETE